MFVLYDLLFLFYSRQSISAFSGRKKKTFIGINCPSWIRWLAALATEVLISLSVGRCCKYWEEVGNVSVTPPIFRVLWLSVTLSVIRRSSSLSPLNRRELGCYHGDKGSDGHGCVRYVCWSNMKVALSGIPMRNGKWIILPSNNHATRSQTRILSYKFI